MADEIQPFIGPRPFAREHRDRFFGRKRETAHLASLVIAHPIVFLYGQSGTGKTSLLNAGLIQKLEEEEGVFVLPVVRPGSRADQTRAERTTVSPYVYATLLTWSGDTDGSAPPADTNLADYLATLTTERDEDGDPKPRLLIFDQLEEIFRDQIDTGQEQHEFFEQIGKVLYQSRARISVEGESTPSETVPTRVVLSMREEFIAELDPYAALLPDRLRIRFRLERLRAVAALEAVTGPLASTSLAFGPGVADKLVADLREVRVETGVGEARKAVNVLGEFVEPVQLQVVCERLVRDLPPGDSEITMDHLSTFGSVDTTLSEFYKDAVAFAAQRSGVSQVDLGRWCETNLITETGTRAVVHRGPMQSAGMPNAAPDALIERHLLRREPRSGAEWYELTHDRLIGPIQTSRGVRERLDAEWRGAEQARKLLEESRRRRRFVGAAAVVVLLGLAIVTGWYRYRTPDCAGTLNCAWTVETDGEIFGRPAVAGSFVYIPSVDGHIYAIDSSQPKQLWAFVQDGASRQELWRSERLGRISSSPAIDNGVLYVGDEGQQDGTPGTLHALDANDGQERWYFGTGDSVVTSPVLAGGVVYFGSLDCNLYALDVEQRSVRWTVRTQGQLVSSPTLSRGVIYFGSVDGKLYAIDAASGDVLWTQLTDGKIRSTPTVVGGVLYVGTDDATASKGHLIAVDPDSGKRLWTFSQAGAELRSSPVVVDGSVYVASLDSNLYAVDAATGAERWRFATQGRVVSSPLVVDGVVYFGSSDGSLYAVDAAKGQELARLVAGDYVDSSPVLVGDNIIFGSRDSTVYVVDHVPRTSVQASPANGFATPESATPQLATPGRRGTGSGTGSGTGRDTAPPTALEPDPACKPPSDDRAFGPASTEP